MAVDPGDLEEMACAKQIQKRLIERALAAGGTSMGEHGIGLGRRAALLSEHPTGVPVMKAIKAVLDPRGIMNPGKVI